MPRNRLDRAGSRVQPQRVGTSLTLEVTTVPPKVKKAGRCVSRDCNCFTYGVGRHTTQATLSSVLKDKRDGLGETRPRFVLCFAMTVRAWDLRTVGDVPLAVRFYNRREFVMHHGNLVSPPYVERVG